MELESLCALLEKGVETSHQEAANGPVDKDEAGRGRHEVEAPHIGSDHHAGSCLR